MSYYVRTGYRHGIIIGDSSDDAHAERTRQAVEAVRGRVKIEYDRYLGLSSCECLERMGERLTTPYCAYVADDDFLCTGGIEQCVEFLERHPSYGAAHGRGALFSCEGSGPYGRMTGVRRYPLAVLEAETGAQRIQQFLAPPGPRAVIFSVHRTTAWRAIFQGTGRLEGTQNRNVFKDELIPSCLSAIRGKVREVDCLYLVRHAHEGIYRHPSVYDWLTSPLWSRSYQVFQERMIDALIRQDGLRAEDAHAALRRVFWPYLAKNLLDAWTKAQAPSAPSREALLRAAVKRIPGARHAWRGIRAMIQRRRDPCSLPALLDPSSRYYEEFAPVYRAVTEPSTEQLSEALGSRSAEGQTHDAREVAVHG